MRGVLISVNIRDSEKAKKLLQDIDEKSKELDALCYQLEKCLRVEFEMKKEPVDNSAGSR